ncbi:MAG: response regulator transcription factor [Ignavibacteria bacterium]|nr:response regulator transcription factor [Ignavibacteria bacterium]MBK7412777.1 response regulator transcription factor [Ignavibacteria bacterium]
MKIRLYIMDDHEMILDGLRSYFAGNDDFEIVGTATDPRVGLEEIIRAKDVIDIVLTDVEMPHMSGFEVCSKLQAHTVKPKVVFLTYHVNPEIRYKVERSKAEGLIYKNASREELFHLLKLVHEGELGRVVTKLTYFPSPTALTTTELRVLYYIGCCHYTTKQIAAEMFRSEETINSHRKNIMSKLDVHKNTELVHYAENLGLCKNPPV